MRTPEHVAGPTRRTKVQRAAAADARATHDADGGGLAALQRVAGNRAVTELVQAKLQVGAVDDPLEREADHVARKVVAGAQQHLAGGATSSAAAGSPTVRRRATPGGVGAGGGELDTGTDAAIRRASGGGQALDPALRGAMEAGFGADFSAVRVHLDAGADALNRQLGARAFTTGSDIFFREGEYAPGSTQGQELVAHELTHVVQQGATGTTGEPVHRSADPRAVQRKAYPIGTTGESLEVGLLTSKKEREALLVEAAQIIADLRATYGVAVSSSETVAGIKDNYTSVSAKVLDSLRAQPWRIKELRALSRALSYYAAILGAKRADSTRDGAAQEVASVGKVRQAINKDTSAGKLDTTTLGEYFESKKNMGLFKASEKFKADFDNVGDQLTGTFVHEIAHGLLAYALQDYIDATGYWRDADQELALPKRVEWPVTDYGETNAAEDMCESAMMYFVAPQRLKNSCPLRYAFMQKIGTDWVPAPSEAPQVQPDAQGVVPEVADSSDVSVPPELEQAQTAIDTIVQKVDAQAPVAASGGDAAPDAATWETAAPSASRGTPLIGANRSGGSA